MKLVSMEAAPGERHDDLASVLSIPRTITV
jgi:hypothetical protein